MDLELGRSVGSTEASLLIGPNEQALRCEDNLIFFFKLRTGGAC